MPDCVGFHERRLAGHERFRRPALAGGDLVHASLRRDGSVRLQDLVGFAFPGVFVAMLDQQPVGPLTAVAVIAHSHQDPTAVQLLAMESELEVALLEPARGVVRLPIAAVPEQDSPAAILAFGNGAFEVAVVERMIFDLDGQPLVTRIERWAFGHRPGFEHTVEFQPEIIMQPAGVVLLDHESPLGGRSDLNLAAGLRGLFKIPLFPVGGQASQGHDQSRSSASTPRAAAKLKPAKAVEVPNRRTCRHARNCGGPIQKGVRLPAKTCLFHCRTGHPHLTRSKQDVDARTGWLSDFSAGLIASTCVPTSSCRSSWKISSNSFSHSSSEGLSFLLALPPTNQSRSPAFGL